LYFRIAGRIDLVTLKDIVEIVFRECFESAKIEGGARERERERGGKKEREKGGKKKKTCLMIKSLLSVTNEYSNSKNQSYSLNR